MTIATYIKTKMAAVKAAKAKAAAAAKLARAKAAKAAAKAGRRPPAHWPGPRPGPKGPTEYAPIDSVADWVDWGAGAGRYYAPKPLHPVVPRGSVWLKARPAARPVRAPAARPRPVRALVPPRLTPT